jgi:hypothetical protein
MRDILDWRRISQQTLIREHLMTIDLQDMYHGAALTKIVEHEEFTALNKADEQYGHYLVNKDILLWVKYATKPNGPWQFTFTAADANGILKDDGDQKKRTFVVLVCGKSAVCCVEVETLKEIADLQSGKSQGVKATSLARKQIRLSGPLTKGMKPIKVPRNRFPDCIFD